LPASTSFDDVLYERAGKDQAGGDEGAEHRSAVGVEQDDGGGCASQVAHDKGDSGHPPIGTRSKELCFMCPSNPDPVPSEAPPGFRGRSFRRLSGDSSAVEGQIELRRFHLEGEARWLLIHRRRLRRTERAWCPMPRRVPCWDLASLSAKIRKRNFAHSENRHPGICRANMPPARLCRRQDKQNAE
jgi:hypothetical protein